VYPPLSSDEVDQIASHVGVIKFGALRPEAMNAALRDIGRMFYVARDWTLSNMAQTIAAFSEWGGKQLSQKGVLPPQLDGLLHNALNSIQSMDRMSPEAQEVFKKELANFVGVSIWQNQWRAQLASLMIKGQLTIQNPPGYETSIATGQYEYSKSQGRLVPHEKYTNINGWLNDFYSIVPFDLRLPSRVDRFTAKTALDAIHFNPVKPIAMEFNKESIGLGTLYDMQNAYTLAKQRGLPPGQTFGMMIRSAVASPMPLPAKMAWQEYNRTGKINDFFYAMAFSVMGRPQVRIRPSPQTLKKEQSNNGNFAQDFIKAFKKQPPRGKGIGGFGGL
jgi:hypothetical protein